MTRSNGQSRYEAPDIAAMMKRMARAMVRRAQEGDLEAVKCMAEVERAVRDAVVEAARAAHYGPYAYSWNEIARDLGVTRQAVQKRCALPVDQDDRCEHGYYLTGGTGTCPMPPEQHKERAS